MPMGLPRSKTIKVPNAPKSPLRAKASSAPPGSISSSRVTSRSAAGISLIAGAVMPPPQPKAREATFSPLATWSGLRVTGKITGSAPRGRRVGSCSRNLPAGSASVDPSARAGMGRMASMAVVTLATASVNAVSPAKSMRISDKPSLIEAVVAVAPGREESAASKVCSTRATSPASNAGGASISVLTRICGLTTSRLLRSIRLPGTLPISVAKRLILYSGGVVVTAAPKIVPAQETLPLLPTRSVSSACRSVLSEIALQRMPSKVEVRSNRCTMSWPAF